MVSAFAWHAREPGFDPQLRKIIIAFFSYPVITYSLSLENSIAIIVCLIILEA